MIDLASEHLRNTAAAYPERTALTDGEREFSWRELDDSVERLARRLVAIGFGPGQSVMIMSENNAEFLILCFGVWRAGGVMAVVHASIGPDELDYALTNAEPALLFAERPYLDAAGAALARTARPTRLLELSADLDVLRDVEPAAVALPEVDPEALGIIGYTSGTTGRPKPVAHTHLTIARGTDGVADMWRFASDDTILVAMPLSWMMGLIILSVSATTRGSRIHLLRRFNAVDVVDAIIERGVTFFAASTSMYAKVLDAWPRRDSPVTLRLRCCISAGEARNEAAFGQWRRLTGMPVLDSYGAFECWPLVTHDPASATLPPRGSAGRVVTGARLRVLGPDGHEVERGQVGEAQGLAPCMMMGYWREPELTASTITPDGWYRTGDYARVDDDGFVYILGRAGDLIVHAGHHVFSAEVEQVLSELDEIAEVAVVGIPDDEFGQVVAAAVVAASGTAPAEAAMRAHCATRLEAAKVPTIIRIVEELPHNASGKILRREVVPILSEAHAATSD